jgi:hypothetical protein
MITESSLVVLEYHPALEKARGHLLGLEVLVNRELVDDWFDAFRERDISKLRLADDFVHTSPFGEIRGGQTYIDLVRKNSEAFFAPTIEILDVIDGGDRFAVRYLVNENPACDCIYVQDDQILEIHSYYHVGEKPTLYDEWQA